MDRPPEVKILVIVRKWRLCTEVAVSEGSTVAKLAQSKRDKRNFYSISFPHIATILRKYKT